MSDPTWAEMLARRATEAVSSTGGACFALAVVVFCLVAALFVGWEQAYMGTDPIATLGSFLLLFLLQRSQRKDTLSLHVKLDELLAAVREANSGLISIEERSEEEVRRTHEDHARRSS